MKRINDKAILVGFEDFELPEDTEIIGCPATSTEHLDKYRKMGIKIVDLGFGNDRDEETKAFMDTISSTSEHTIGLMLALARNYKTALHSPYLERKVGRTLSGKTLGIIGFGRVGQQVARIAKAFGMKVVYWDSEAQEGVIKAFDGETGGVDFLSLHIPLKGNEGFFTKGMFKNMKPTAYFINTSRPGIVEDGALLWALENGEIAGAAVDFTDDPALLEYEKTHDNLVLTPHLGGNTVEDKEKTEEFIINKVKKYGKNTN